MPGPTDAAMTAWTQEQSLAERFALAVTQLNRLKGVLVRLRGRVTLGGTANDMIILHRAAGVGLDQTLPLVEALLERTSSPAELMLVSWSRRRRMIRRRVWRSPASGQRAGAPEGPA